MSPPDGNVNLGALFSPLASYLAGILRVSRTSAYKGAKLNLKAFLAWSSSSFAFFSMRRYAFLFFYASILDSSRDVLVFLRRSELEFMEILYECSSL